MTIGNLYFLKDEYFADFPDPLLMRNKEAVNGKHHDRACFFSFYDDSGKIFWMIPFSSNVNKFRDIYNKKMAKYEECDTITFGNVLGYPKAFLIQNMCPVTDEYIKNEYKDANATPVRLDGALEGELIRLGRKILALERQGRRIIFPDVLKIEKELLAKLVKTENPSVETNKG